MELENLSVDELEAHKLELHAQEDELRERLRAAETVLAKKLGIQRARAALRQAGMDLGADGSVLIAPPPAVIGVEPAEVN
jgi:hypothetical protein